MTTATKMNELMAKVLIVHTSDLNDGNTSSFSVLQFHNGLVAVPSDTTHDWYFESADDIEPCGTDVVDSIEETGETVFWTKAELRRSVGGSISEFGVDSAPSNWKELLK